ncbi:MAG: sigma-70 family RNA polymerase sigma factor [Clostridia bacterium]|nr:sigma-70 family RNA polymerase sigma factor [Clostridia bacterium]
MSNEVDRLRLRDLFVSDYLEKLFYFCLKKTGNAHEAEDLASDVSLDVLTAIEKGTEIKHFSAWVWRIARNRYASWVADKNAEKAATCPGDVSEYGAAADECPEDELARAEQIGRLRRELAFISSDYREIVVAYYVKQKRIFEIAESLSIPEGTVKTKLYRARQKLKEGMLMAREFGKRSYDPESIYFVANGSQPDGLPWKAVKRKIPVNILCEANNNPSTAEELSIELGVALPYMEEEISLLEQATLLKKIDGGKYLTNFFIYPVACENEICEIVCDYCEDVYEGIWKLAEKTVSREAGKTCDVSAVGEGDTAMYFSFLIGDLLKECALPPSAFKRFIRPNGADWGFCGFENGFLCRLPEEFFNGNSSGDDRWCGYQISRGTTDRFPCLRYLERNGVPDQITLPVLKLVAEGKSFDELKEEHEGILDYLIRKGFVNNENGKLTVDAILCRDREACTDRIKADPDFASLLERTKKMTKKAYASVAKYANPYLKDDLDYYVESGLFRTRSILACLWKDRGLYTGKSAQFCTLLLS